MYYELRILKFAILNSQLLLVMEKEKFIQEIESMSVGELNELVKALEEKFGVSTASLVGSAGSPQAVFAEAGEEKDSYTVVLKDAGMAKIQVIKILREVTGLGLKEAKDITDKVPVNVKEDVKKADADEIKKKLEEAGATVELK